MLEPSLEELLANTLSVPLPEISEQSSMDNTAGWDSLRHMMLMGELESCYRIRLSDNERIAATSIAQIRAILGKRGLG
jgi:acyl carrier protein